MHVIDCRKISHFLNDEILNRMTYIKLNTPSPTWQFSFVELQQGPSNEACLGSSQTVTQPFDLEDNGFQ